MEGEPAIAILQVDSSLRPDERDIVRLPDFLQIDREITDVPEYLSMGLAKRVQN